MTPFPSFPHSDTTNGGGEYNVLMKIAVSIQFKVTPPPIAFFNWGRLGRESDA